MDFADSYEIDKTADFIHSNNFTRVALQFPDELLKYSTRVVKALRHKLCSLNTNEFGLFVMADSTYGSCCVDEVGASHINADCVIHYGHTCLSPTSQLLAYFVFGKAKINAARCAESLLRYVADVQKPVMVLFGLEYAHSIPTIKEELGKSLAQLSSSNPNSFSEFRFADALPSATSPINSRDCEELQSLSNGCASGNGACVNPGSVHSSVGLVWDLPQGHKMEDYLLVWIGSDNSAFANVVLLYNSCDIVRYNPAEENLVIDLSQQRKILKRRYYLVEKAKDAKIVGILVGTLGVAGYLGMISQMKDLITRAGKKAYTLAMGRPNPAKLANFPECDVFVYVSCAQTSLLDSKEYFAPVITPFEAILAFGRGSQWTGSYVMDFRDLINSSVTQIEKQTKEARFSFMHGGYVEDLNLQDDKQEENEGALALANATEKILQLNKANTNLVKGMANSGAEYFAARSYRGLDMYNDNSVSEPYLIGRTGKASGYKDENK